MIIVGVWPRIELCRVANEGVVKIGAIRGDALTRPCCDL